MKKRQGARRKSSYFEPLCLLTMMFFLLLLAFSVNPVKAVEYYVDLATGSNTNSGTNQAPWRTIQKGADTMIAGDRCTVRPGDYPERVEITRSGHANASLVFHADASVSMRGFRFMNKADYIEISGFEIAHVENEYGSYEGGSGIYATGEHCRFLNNNIHHTSSVGIYVNAEPSDSSDSSNILIKDNTIRYIGLCGISIMGSNNIVEGNEISHCLQAPPEALGYDHGDADGMRLYGRGHIIRGNYIHDILYRENSDAHIDMMATYIPGPLVDVLFEKNIIHAKDDDSQGFYFGITSGATYEVHDLTFKNNLCLMNTGYCPAFKFHDQDAAQRVSNIIVVNNTCIGNKTEMLIEINGCKNVDVKNNIFYYSSGVDIVDNSYWKVDSSSNVTIENNLWYVDGVGFPYQNHPQWPGDIRGADPVFVKQTSNPETWDLHLQYSSPCIDAGTNLSGVVDEDMDDIFRPVGSGYDMGAYEYHISIPRPPVGLVIRPQ
jgi:parallel beta-helix repeat protein